MSNLDFDIDQIDELYANEANVSNKVNGNNSIRNKDYIRSRNSSINSSNKNKKKYFNRENSTESRNDRGKIENNYSTRRNYENRNHQKSESNRNNLNKRSDSNSSVKRKSPERIGTDILEIRREFKIILREDCTIALYHINYKATEKDIFNFFSQAGITRIIDIKIRRDKVTKKSLGVAFVEFDSYNAVEKAILLNHSEFMEKSLLIKSIANAKSRTIYKKYNENNDNINKDNKGTKDKSPNIKENGMKIYIGGLVDALSNVCEDDLKELFGVFGEINNINIKRDVSTNKCLGYAFIEFKKASDANEAIKVMNGYSFKGKRFRVGEASDAMIKVGAKNAGDEVINDDEDKKDSSAINNIDITPTVILGKSKTTSNIMPSTPHNSFNYSVINNSNNNQINNSINNGTPYIPSMTTFNSSMNTNMNNLMSMNRFPHFNMNINPHYNMLLNQINTLNPSNSMNHINSMNQMNLVTQMNNQNNNINKHSNINNILSANKKDDLENLNNLSMPMNCFLIKNAFDINDIEDKDKFASIKNDFTYIIESYGETVMIFFNEDKGELLVKMKNLKDAISFKTDNEGKEINDRKIEINYISSLYFDKITNN